MWMLPALAEVCTVSRGLLVRAWPIPLGRPSGPPDVGSFPESWSASMRVDVGLIPVGRGAFYSSCPRLRATLDPLLIGYPQSALPRAIRADEYVDGLQGQIVNDPDAPESADGDFAQSVHAAHRLLPGRPSLDDKGR